MPGCSEKNQVHQQITDITLEKLCNEFEDFPDLCGLIKDDKNEEILRAHVCDPDNPNFVDRDYVIEVSEYCICDGEEVNIYKCNEYMSRSRELEQRLLFASSLDERRSIEEELRKIPRCKKQKLKPRPPEPVKHHHPDGVNIMLWWYYVYTAAKDCLEASKGSSEKIRESMIRLARALHYAQDGPIIRYMKIKGAYDIYTVRVDELHNIFEKEISEIVKRGLNDFNISTPIMEGVKMALNERKEDMFNISTMSKKLCSVEKDSIIDAIKAMFRNTAYTFTKFIQIIRFVRREGKKIQQLYMLYRALRVAGYATISLLILLVFVLPQTSAYVWLAVIGALLFASSQLLYSRIRPMICLYMNVDCENYEDEILTERSEEEKTEKGTRTVTKRYAPAPIK